MKRAPVMFIAASSGPGSSGSTFEAQSGSGGPQNRERPGQARRPATQVPARRGVVARRCRSCNAAARA